MQGRYIARHDYPILVENKVVGKVTSGTLSPTLNEAIALGYVPYNYSKRGQILTVEIRGKQYPAEIVKKAREFEFWIFSTPTALGFSISKVPRVGA